MIDSNNLFIDDFSERVSDVSSAFITISSSVAFGVFEKYNVSYIYFSFRAEDSYKVSDLGYLNECIEMVFGGENFELYEIKC